MKGSPTSEAHLRPPSNAHPFSEMKGFQFASSWSAEQKAKYSLGVSLHCRSLGPRPPWEGVRGA